MKRIKCNSVTDAIVEAMSKAEEMEHVLILYQAKNGHDQGASFNDSTLDIGTANFMLDKFKYWLMSKELNDKR